MANTLRREVSQFLASHHRHLIDGQWCDSVSAKTFEVFDPAEGQAIGTVAEGDAADIDHAVAAARRSFEDRRWRGLTADARGRVLWRWGDLVERNAEELSQLEVANNGMTLELATWLVAAGAGWLREYAGHTSKIFGRNASGAISGGGQKMHAYTSREPVGVAGLITPWNGPIGSFINKVGPALAAGCSVVVKPAENTPLTALRLAALGLEAGIPNGVLNVVTGFGPTAGQALVNHRGVDKISFTGSTAVGKQIVRAASDNLKRVTLELGGKSPLIVFDDADLRLAIPGAANAIFFNSGQVCLAGSRLFVQARVFDEVLAGIANIAQSIRLGSGLDPRTQMGPLISAKQKERVSQYVELGKREGAELVAGGGAPMGNGYFIEPTVFANVKPEMRIVREEIFGPVLVATRFEDIDDVVRLANDTRYGLGSGLYTQDVNKAHLIAERLEAGNVWVNCYGVLEPSMPFGGYKESGWGREMGADGVDSFLETKSVFIHLH
jgi:acyl-CoA reductase-like NAD-dependent aldehyde dehydrogenase